jgi:very-short-patch-repair endonuclease
MTKLYNKSSEKFKRQSLRNNIPPAEKLLWEKLRRRQVEDCKFRRQYSIAAFVVDFYSPELKLVIEVDGESHFVEGAQEYDQERDTFLISKGTQILRFTNSHVYEKLDGVLVVIAQKIHQLRQS